MFDWVGIMEIPHMATLISIMLGFGLAAIFRPLCKGPECLILRGPPVSEIKGAAFQFGSKCVEFIPTPQECPTGDAAKTIVQTLSFADLS
jgi:hypothetical protein